MQNIKPTKITNVVSCRPHQQVHTRSVGLHVDLELVDHSEVGLLVFSLAGIVLSGLQFRLARQEQAPDKLLDVFGEGGGEI